MLAVPIFHSGLVHQPEIGLVDQARRTEGVLLALTEELPVSDPSQLLVDQWKQPVERAGVARAQLEQKIGDWTAGVIGRGHLL
jgi:hypothetical protein